MKQAMALLDRACDTVARWNGVPSWQVQQPFVVTWAAPMDLPDHERLVLAGWLRVHGIERVQYRPNSGDRAASVCVATHPLLGEVIVSVQYVTDGRGRYVMAFGSHTEVARRVQVQPLGMPVPAVLRERGEARAAQLGLRLPVAALLGGRRGER